MSPSKQNLFLFFEENEMQNSIDRKLVLLYANYCIIDEEAGFEICGVYQLQFVSKLMYVVENPLYKTNAKQRTNKEANDKYIISEAFEKAYATQSNSIDTHFIIGSSFYSSAGDWPTIINRPRKLKEMISDEMKSHEVRTVHVTLLAGSRSALINQRNEYINI